MNVTAEIRHNKIVLVAARVSIYCIYPKVVPLLLNRLSWWSCLFQHSLGMSSVYHRHSRTRPRTHTLAQGNLQTESNLCAGSWTVARNRKPTLIHAHRKVTKYKYKSHIKSNRCPQRNHSFYYFFVPNFLSAKFIFSIPVPKYSKYQSMHEHLFSI